jgi:porin
MSNPHVIQSLATGLTAVGLLACLGGEPAGAAPPPLAPAEGPEAVEQAAGGGPFGFVTGLSKSDYLLGDMWGLRSALSKYGISFGSPKPARCWAI